MNFVCKKTRLRSEKNDEKTKHCGMKRKINYNDLLIKINFNENDEKKYGKNIKLHRILSAVNFDFKTLKLLIN